MKFFVLDCSVTMTWFFVDEYTSFTQSIQESLESGRHAIVPHIWNLEVLNTFLVAERRKRIDTTHTTRFLMLLRNLPIHVEPVPSPSIEDELLNLARRFSLTAYDAAYLELAVRRGLPMATLDQEIEKAARALNVSLFQPGALPDNG